MCSPRAGASRRISPGVALNFTGTPTIGTGPCPGRPPSWLQAVAITWGSLTRSPQSRTVGGPVKFSAKPGEIRRLAPALGEHTHEVLLECGLTQDEIDRLEREGVIRQDRPGAD